MNDIVMNVDISVILMVYKYNIYDKPFIFHVVPLLTVTTMRNDTTRIGIRKVRICDPFVILMWIKQCHKPPMTGNGKHTTCLW